MLDRAFIVTPYNAAFGGAALVNAAGSVIGVTSLRLGEAPHVNLAIPIEKFLAGKDELLAQGRVTSRAPRPWLGLYTESVGGGVVVAGMSPLGPAGPPASAGGRRDRPAQRRGGGEREEFYRGCGRRRWIRTCSVIVRRDRARREAITVTAAGPLPFLSHLRRVG